MERSCCDERVQTNYSTRLRQRNAMHGLDLPGKLADHVRMDARNGSFGREDDSRSPQSGPHWQRRLGWAVAAALAVVVVALAFGAYRQPELLLNIMGLRYCG